MFDFTWTSPTYWSSIYCVLGFVCFISTYQKKYTTDVVPGRVRLDKGLAFFSLLLAMTISVDGDWYHYQTLVWDYDFSPYAHNHGEPVYGYLIKFLDKNYFLFRLVVWGAALWISYRTFRRFRLDVNVSVFFLMAVFLLKFNYARSSLAMACYFYGLSFVLIRTKWWRTYDFILAALFLFLCYSFHHSCLLLIVFTFVIFIPINKYTVAGAVVLLPLLSGLTSYYLNLFLDDKELLSNEYLQTKLTIYSKREYGGANIFGKIYNTIQYGAFYIPLLITTVSIFKNRFRVEKPVFDVYKVMLLVVIFSITFVLVNVNLMTFYYRILFMTLIPLTIITVYLYQSRILSPKWFHVIVWWGIVSNMYRILYCLYTVILGRPFA